jgi:hypothetical protein
MGGFPIGRVLPAKLEGDAAQHWERLSDEAKLPTASVEAMMAYAKKRELRDLPTAAQTAARQELVELGVPQKECSAIIEAMIHKEIAGRSGKYAGEPKRRAVGDWLNGQRWVQSENAFVTILKKDDLTADATDPAGIMACLHEAVFDTKSQKRPTILRLQDRRSEAIAVRQ